MNKNFNFVLGDWSGSLKAGFQWKHATDAQKIEKLNEPPVGDEPGAFTVLRRIREDKLAHTDQDDRATIKALNNDLKNIADALDNQFLEGLKRKIQGSIVQLDDPDMSVQSLRRDQFMKIYNEYKYLHPKLTSVLPGDEVGMHSRPEKLRRSMQMLTRRSQVFGDELRDLVYDPLKALKIELAQCADLLELDQAILVIANDIMSDVDDVRVISLTEENAELSAKVHILSLSNVWNLEHLMIQC